METIDEARAYLRNNMETGTKCPCCGRNVKLYNYMINSSLARALISLYKLSLRSQPNHVKDILVGLPHSCGKNFCILKHWELIKEVVNTDTHKRASGFWYITPQGTNFILNKIRIPRTVKIFNDKIYAISDEKIGIYDCLGTEFDYSELMR